mgnify:CR=1 FL=1
MKDSIGKFGLEFDGTHFQLTSKITNCLAPDHCGIPENKILRRYVLRVALPATVTVLGVSIGFILSTAVIVEILFSRPGIGKLTYDAVISRNYPVVMGAVLASTVFIVVATTLSDLLNVMLDPRSQDINS